MIIIVMKQSHVAGLRNKSDCGGETEVFQSIVVLWCFSSEDQYLRLKSVFRSALIFWFLYSAGLKFENVFSKLFQPITQLYLADCVP